MKIVYFLFASVLVFINCRLFCEIEDETDPKKSDCVDYELNALEKLGADSCCFVKVKGKSDGKTVEEKWCELFTKEKVLDELKERKKVKGVKSYSIDCSSNWLSITLLFVILALCF